MRRYANAAVSTASAKKAKRLVFDNRSPSFQDFLSKQQPVKTSIDQALTQPDNIPYLQMDSKTLGRGRKFYIEVYGCQVTG